MFRHELTLSVALLVLAGSLFWCTAAAEGQDSPTERLSYEESRRAKEIYDGAMRKAATTPEALKLKEHLDTCVALLNQSQNAQRQYAYELMTGRGSFGTAAAMLTAEQQTRTNQRATLRASERLQKYLKQTAWDSLTQSEQELCAKAMPEFARVAGAAVSAASQAKPPAGWVRQELNDHVVVSFPAQPEKTASEFLRYEAQLPDINARFECVGLVGMEDEVRNLKAKPEGLAQLFRFFGQSLAKHSLGSIEKSESAMRNGRNGWWVVFRWEGDGLERKADVWMFEHAGGIYACSVNRPAKADVTDLQERFFDSIETR